MSLRLLTKLALIGCFAISAIGTSACRAGKPQPATASAQPSPAQTPEPEYVSNPTCCGLLTAHTQRIDAAWRTFTADGRYRLARKDDFKPPARAFGSDDPLNSIFAYCWGQLGYDGRSDRDHLAAIVIDTHRSDDARFSLVIFSVAKNGDGTYQPYWLYRNRDLSRTVVWTGSGDLMVADYRDDGSRVASLVHWDAARKQFVTTASRPRPT